MAPKAPKKLTPKEQLFVAEYLISFNASEAHKKAGFKGKSHGTLGSRMLKYVHIAEAIEAGKAKTAEKLEITQEIVLAEIAKVGLATMRRFMRVDQDGQPQIDLTDTPDDDLDALSEIQTETVMEGSGTGSDGKKAFDRVRKTKIKLHDKLAALEKLARFTGVYDKETEKNAGAFAEAILDIQTRMSRAPIRRDSATQDGDQ